MLEKIKNLILFLDNHNIEYEKNIELEKITYFKSGGKINILLTPQDVEKLKLIVIFLNEKILQYKIIGGTTNCIFLDQTNIDIVISLKKFKSILFDSLNNEMIVEAGVKLPTLVAQLKNKSIEGFEGLEGIPAMLGGAIYMNAGSYGYEISDNLISITIMDKYGRIFQLTKEECIFSYRKSIFHEIHKDKIIIFIKFKIRKGNKIEIENKITFYYNHRRTTLEYKNPNVGSVFVTHDIYSEFAKKSFLYKIILFFMRTFVHRIIRAKSNFLLNIITLRFFGLNLYSDLVSKKTMNVVINNGTGTDKIIKYIDKVNLLIGADIRREIEII